MKYPLVVLMGAAALAFAGLAQAHETPRPVVNGGAFLGLQLGTTAWSSGDNYDDSENHRSYAGRLGYRWSINPGNAIGLEVSYADFGRMTASGSITVPGGYAGRRTLYYTGRLDATAAMLGVNYELTFGGGRGFFDVRLGTMRLQLDATVTGGLYGSVSDSETDNGAYLGVGVGYYVTPGVGLGLNYDFHQATVQGEDANLASLSVGVVFRF
jgi:OOP family OmpA-OmpF porin